MKVAVISFTQVGSDRNTEIVSYLKNQQIEVFGYTLSKYKREGLEELQGSLQEWTNRMFEEMEALLFISATGIAVRSIAPYIKDKTTDPAVLVMDEEKTYVISLLSGHLGGANALCELLAKQFQAIPIITTATDLHHVFAVDNFAKRNRLYIADMQLAKAISVALLHHIPVSIESDLSHRGTLSKGLTNEYTKLGIYIGIYRKQPYPQTLSLIPKLLYVGMGCKKGTPKERLQAFLKEVFQTYQLHTSAIHSIVSINLKKDEKGLCLLAASYHVPFHTYAAEELRQVTGDFQSSVFVQAVTNVDNVCERSAVLAANGPLLIRKETKDGMSIAVAIQEGSVHFE